LEFWVKTPEETAEIEELSYNQVMQENYWARTRGQAATALEEAILMLSRYGLEPEMVPQGSRRPQSPQSANPAAAPMSSSKWKSTGASPTPAGGRQRTSGQDYRKEVFPRKWSRSHLQSQANHRRRRQREHTHVCIAARLKSGKLVNLFAPKEMKDDFLSAVGYGAIMGLHKNYEVVNPLYPPPSIPSTASSRLRSSGLHRHLVGSQSGYAFS
jgi:glutamine synthetase